MYCSLWLLSHTEICHCYSPLFCQRALIQNVSSLWLLVEANSLNCLLRGQEAVATKKATVPTVVWPFYLKQSIKTQRGSGLCFTQFA
jgi:hypothetical protein